jgi:hypothetical protein
LYSALKRRRYLRSCSDDATTSVSLFFDFGTALDHLRPSWIAHSIPNDGVSPVFDSWGRRGETANPIKTSSTPIIDSVLFFTYYIYPMDAERDWHCSDLIPGISMGLSFTAPTNNFYIGGVSEFPGARNMQIVYGFTIAKRAFVANPETQPMSTMANPTPAVATVQKFEAGWYAGLSLNILGFIQTVIGK